MAHAWPSRGSAQNKIQATCDAGKPLKAAIEGARVNLDLGWISVHREALSRGHVDPMRRRISSRTGLFYICSPSVMRVIMPAPRVNKLMSEDAKKDLRMHFCERTGRATARSAWNALNTMLERRVLDRTCNITSTLQSWQTLRKMRVQN